eukprot:12586663-Heterocapsa_arctica.AAC.1
MLHPASNSAPAAAPSRRPPPRPNSPRDPSAHPRGSRHQARTSPEAARPTAGAREAAPPRA